MEERMRFVLKSRVSVPLAFRAMVLTIKQARRLFYTTKGLGPRQNYRPRNLVI